MKKFTKWEISVIKTTAKNVSRFYAQQAKITEKINALKKEYEAVDKTIESFETPIRTMTGGYSTADLINREVKEGANVATYSLKYPDTVIPPCEGEEGNKTTDVEPEVVSEPEAEAETVKAVFADTPVAPQSQPVPETEELNVDVNPEGKSDIDMQEVSEAAEEDPDFTESEEEENFGF